VEKPKVILQSPDQIDRVLVVSLQVFSWGGRAMARVLRFDSTRFGEHETRGCIIDARETMRIFIDQFQILALTSPKIALAILHYVNWIAQDWGPFS
jgi:hypothetical protein